MSEPYVELKMISVKEGDFLQGTFNDTEGEVVFRNDNQVVIETKQGNCVVIDQDHIGNYKKISENLVLHVNVSQLEYLFESYTSFDDILEGLRRYAK